MKFSTASAAPTHGPPPPFLQNNNNGVNTAGAIQLTVPMVPLQTFQQLLFENQQLKQALDQKCTDNASLQAEISRQLTLVRSLDEQNRILREALARLEAENLEMKKDLSGLKSDVQKFKQDKILGALTLALQDLNRADQLERNIPAISKSLRKLLRQNRNDAAHYIDENDVADLLGYKKLALLRTLLNLSPQLRMTMDRKFPSLLTTLIPYLERIGLDAFETKVSSEEKDEVDEWWEND